MLRASEAADELTTEQKESDSTSVNEDNINGVITNTDMTKNMSTNSGRQHMAHPTAESVARARQKISLSKERRATRTLLMIVAGFTGWWRIFCC